MPGPWEQYQQQPQAQPQAGPWSNYGDAVEPPQPQPQEPISRKILRGLGIALPIVGGIGGGIIGAGAGPLGAIGGGGVGAMLGQEGQEAINRYALGDQPLSAQESARNLGMAGALGAVGEVPGALMMGAGGRVLSNVARVQKAAETGSAAAGLAEQAPIGFSGQGIKRSLDAAHENLSGQLSSVLQSAPGTRSLSQTIDLTRLRAAQSKVPGMTDWLDNIIEAAKESAKIKGDQATADQLLRFAQELTPDRVYSGDPAVLQSLKNSYLQQMYAQASNGVRTLAPDTGPLLDQLTNLHAAKSAVQRYNLGTTGATLLTAATHPTPTAALSPGVAIGGALAPSVTRTQIANILSQFLP